MNSLKTVLLWLFCLAWFGCELSPSERCSGDLVWDEAVQLCHANPEVIDTETDTVGTDIEVDGGGDGPTFGTTCTADEDCTGEVDFCLISPFAPNDPGVCTLENCSAEDCPDTFRCCDCSSLGLQVACVPEEDAGMVQAFGCSCS